MRQISILTFLFLIFLSCKTTAEKKSELMIQSGSTEKILGKKFFEYDAIDYYKIDIDELKIEEFYAKKSRSEIDSLRIGIILGDIPNSMNDLSFIEELARVGYKKTIVDKSKFENIDKIFVEKATLENLATSCIYVYRDILIFKKEGKVIGTAKICFGCLANQIQGTTANTYNFGQDGDYGELEKILQQ